MITSKSTCSYGYSNGGPLGTALSMEGYVDQGPDSAEQFAYVL